MMLWRFSFRLEMLGDFASERLVISNLGPKFWSPDENNMPIIIIQINDGHACAPSISYILLIATPTRDVASKIASLVTLLAAHGNSCGPFHSQVPWIDEIAYRSIDNLDRTPSPAPRRVASCPHRVSHLNPSNPRPWSTLPRNLTSLHIVYSMHSLRLTASATLGRVGAGDRSTYSTQALPHLGKVEEQYQTGF